MDVQVAYECASQDARDDSDLYDDGEEEVSSRAEG
jgi:hypothetical protein